MRGSVVLMIAVVLAAACGGAVRTAVKDGLDEGTQRANWEKLRAPLRDLTGEIAKAVLDAGASPEVAARLNTATERFVRTILHAVSEDLDAEVSPALARTVRASVDAAVAAILSDGTQRRAEAIADAVTPAAMTGLARGIREQIAPALANALDTTLAPAMQRAIQNSLGPAFAATLQHDLGPALAATLQHDLGPALAATLQHDLGPALAATLSKDFTPVLVDIARQTSTATGKGLEPLVDRGFAGIQALIDRTEQGAHSTLVLVLIVVLACATGALAIACWLRHRAATAGQGALHLVTTEIGRMPGEPAIQELARRIKVAGEGSKAGAFLADHLRTHPSSKLSPPTRP